MDQFTSKFLPPLFNSGLVFGVNRNQAIAFLKIDSSAVLINQQLTMHRPHKNLDSRRWVSVEQIGKLSAVAPKAIIDQALLGGTLQLVI